MNKLVALSVAGALVASVAVTPAFAQAKAPVKKAPTTQEIVTYAALGCIIVGGVVAVVTHGFGSTVLLACAGGAVLGAVVKAGS